jgi:hypothetical protein
MLAVDWTAVGSIAGGFGAISAFLAILATVAVYLFQSTGDKATAIRQNLQFIHGQQLQIIPSIESGLLATIDRQTRDFRERLGPAAKPDYFIDQLFGNHQTTCGRPLFRASALDSNLSSATYARICDIWEGMNMKASEYRGALRIFSYACEVLTEESRRLFLPEFTISILDAMAERGDRDAFSKVNSLDELVNILLSSQIELASRQFTDVYKEKIGQGCFFIGMLADMVLRLSDRELVKLARKNVQQPRIGELKTSPCQALETSLGHLAPKLPEQELTALRGVLHRWAPQPTGAQPTS